MALKPPTAHSREISTSIASARAVILRSEARLDTAREQVLRADAMVRRVRVYLEEYDERHDTAVAHALAARKNGMRRRR